MPHSLPATLLIGLALAVAACRPPATPDPPPPEVPAPPVSAQPRPEPTTELPSPDNPETAELLPGEFDWIWQPWTGNYEGIVERRVLRVLTPYGGYQFYYDNGRPRGATWEMLVRFEDWLNAELGRRNVKVYVIAIPVSRDQLIPGLIEGTGDLVATDLTVTPQREAVVTFTRPLLTGINEVVVLGPTAPAIGSLDELAGQEVFVRPTSSYAEHLRALAGDFESRGLEPPVILPADEILEAEDLLDMLQAGAAGITVMDDYKAEFWAEVMSQIDVRNDLVVSAGSEVAWAMRKDDAQLADVLERFLRKFGKGSAFGNDVYRRHLQRPDRVRCADSPRAYARVQPYIDLFRRYGEEYGFDWMRLAAQGYQESGLRQNRRSPAGAVGIMQIKPSTAADRNVGIEDVSTAENNIHAGARYMRFIADRYFADAGIDELDRWIFSLAAYNAGPARISRYRREAAEKGYDPNAWFDNVEIIAARRIGPETVTYVSNIYKYYLGYELASSRNEVVTERYGEQAGLCDADAG